MKKKPGFKINKKKDRGFEVWKSKKGFTVYLYRIYRGLNQEQVDELRKGWEK